MPRARALPSALARARTRHGGVPRGLPLAHLPGFSGRVPRRSESRAAHRSTPMRTHWRCVSALLEIAARTAHRLLTTAQRGSAFATRRTALPPRFDLEGNSLGAAVAVFPVHRFKRRGQALYRRRAPARGLWPSRPVRSSAIMTAAWDIPLVSLSLFLLFSISAQEARRGVFLIETANSLSDVVKTHWRLALATCHDRRRPTLIAKCSPRPLRALRAIVTSATNSAPVSLRRWSPSNLLQKFEKSLFLKILKNVLKECLGNVLTVFCILI
jgi:hypothetical protein